MQEKLGAFTLTELLVGMVITGLVITIGFTAWILIHRQQTQYQQKTDLYKEIIRLEGLLINDIDRSDTVTLEENILKCRTKQTTIAYTFMDSLIVRRFLQHEDTIEISTQLPTIHFENPNLPPMANEAIDIFISLKKVTYDIIIRKTITTITPQANYSIGT
jgi:hypothetical protein